MKKILLISNYYPPEKGAAANRIERLAHQLLKNGYAVQVVCPLGNYPHGKLFAEYRNKFSVSEVRNGISVKRLWIYPSNSKNALKRIVSTLSFVSGLFLYLVTSKLPDKVIVQSPPLIVSFVSVVALRLRRRKIILNVSDLWPLAAIELGALKPGSSSHKISLRIEKYIYRTASVVLGQSDEILAHVKTIVPEKNCFLYRNYPATGSRFIATGTDPKIRFFYAGLLGVAQGILEVCKNLQIAENSEFHIFGDGAEREQIVSYIRENPDKNIRFHGMVERDRLSGELASLDVALVPLTKRIYGSVPSKIFEYSAIGIPILYFGGGEGETIVRQNNLGWVANVGDFSALNAVVNEIQTEGKLRLQLMKTRVFEQSARFNIDAQMQQLIESSVF